MMENEKLTSKIEENRRSIAELKAEIERLKSLLGVEIKEDQSTPSAPSTKANPPPKDR
jgi:hypothetical protein